METAVKELSTEEVVAGMLKENTGIAMMDSGGKDGRMWQRNQIREFASEDAVVLSFKYDDIEFTKNLYHWMVENLEYDAEMTAELEAFAETPGNEDRNWLQLMEEFAVEKEWRGLYGEGEAFTTNTYNHQSVLSQIIQFVYGDKDDVKYVLLQVHGGADVRGGYTAPKAFRVAEEPSIFMDSDGYIFCSERCGANWSTDDAYSWYADGSCGGDSGKQLETYEMRRVDNSESAQKIADDLLALEDFDCSKPEPVLLINEEDDVAYCPECLAKGKLSILKGC